MNIKMYNKVKELDGRRTLYFFGVKFFSYQRNQQTKMHPKIRLIEKKLQNFSETGIAEKDAREKKLIVSLTSFPARMESIHTCLYSLLTQSLKPDMVLLWLAYENFPNKEKDIPQKILDLQENGLTIRWCHDIRSYKKLIPTLKEFPEDVIITADDDIIYSSFWLEKLYQSYVVYPNDIHAHRITRFSYDQKWNTAGKKAFENGSYLNKLVGAGGVLYPPNSLYNDILKEDLFIKLAPTNDDQWFWFQAILNNVKIRLIKENDPDLIYTENSQEIGLFKLNDHGPNLFWYDFNRLLEYYPEVEGKLLAELNNRNLFQSN